MSTHYTTLGIAEDASNSEIKTAFKKLAIIFHPDKNPDNPEAEERFKEINQAYQVLSNPYEKARYDLQIQFSKQPSEFDFTTHQPDTEKPQYEYTYRRAPYAEQIINWRENWIATAYAFGFALIIAALAMTGIWAKDYYDQVKFEEMTTARRATFETAKKYFEEGNLDPSLSILSKMGAFMSIESDMDDFKTDALESLIYKGEQNYNMANYPESIYYYELFEKYAPRNPLLMKEHLATAYRATGHPYRSLKKLTELLIEGHQSMTIYLEKAEIYRDDLKDFEESLRHFKLASNVAIDQYVSTYGNAYPLVMVGRKLPEHHYRIYTGLAKQYLVLKDYDKALKTTDWNIQMWPDSLENYLIAIKANSELNKLDKACEALATARILGFEDQLGFKCP